MPYATRTGLGDRQLKGEDDLPAGLRTVRCQLCGNLFSVPPNVFVSVCRACKSKKELQEQDAQLRRMQEELESQELKMAELHESVQRGLAQAATEQQAERSYQQRQEELRRHRMMVAFYLYGPGSR